MKQNTTPCPCAALDDMYRPGTGRPAYTEYPGYIAALALVKKACAQANAEAGFLDLPRRRASESACDLMAAGAMNERRFLLAPANADGILNDLAKKAIAAKATELEGENVCP